MRNAVSDSPCVACAVAINHGNATTAIVVNRAAIRTRTEVGSRRWPSQYPAANTHGDGEASVSPFEHRQKAGDSQECEEDQRGVSHEEAAIDDKQHARRQTE